MAKRSGLGMNLYVEGRDLSGDVGAIGSLSSPVALQDVTGIDKSAMERIAILGDGNIGFTAFFNDATDAAHETLSALGQKGVMTTIGTTVGSPMAAMTGQMTDYPATRNADGSLTFSPAFASSQGNGLEWGILLTPGMVTHASADSETGVDNTATTSAGGVGFCHIGGADSGTATVLIEDSDDSTDGTDGTWGTLISFTNDSDDAPISERKEVTGEVLDWVRASTTGTFTNAVFAVGFRRGATTDRVSLA